MFRPRIIPTLLLRNSGLVKTVKFKDYRYIGDPINAVKIFNDLKADELVFLDILASTEGRSISLDFVRNVGREAYMPFAVGGGIKDIMTIKNILAAGAEKVVICSEAVNNPSFIKNAADEFGSSTIVVSVDVKKTFLNGNRVFTFSGSKQSSYSPLEFAKLMESNGAGEVIIQSIDKDGIMSGYDWDLIRSIAYELSIPVVALGGAGSLKDLHKAFFNTGASAVSAGSLFVYHGPRNAVLINYPTRSEIRSLFYGDQSNL